MNDENYNYEINVIKSSTKHINEQLDYVNKLIEFYENNWQAMDKEMIERFEKLVVNEFKYVGNIFNELT